MQWYWCLTHDRPETADDRDDVENSLGPYDTEDDARNWKQRNEDRAAEWKAQDEAWDGETDADSSDA